MTWDAKDWKEFDGDCTSCGVHLEWIGDLPEREEDAVCTDCLVVQRDALEQKLAHATELLRQAVVHLVEPMGISYVTKEWRVVAESWTKEVVPLVFGKDPAAFGVRKTTHEAKLDEDVGALALLPRKPMTIRDPIDALVKAHQASTSGEWLHGGGRDVYRQGQVFGRYISRDLEPYDAAFVVLAHNALPALLDYVRALEEVARAARNLSAMSGAWKTRFEAALIALDAIQKGEHT